MLGSFKKTLSVGTALALTSASLLAAAAADAAIVEAVDSAKLTFQAVLTAGLIITGSMIGWGFLKRIRKG